LRRKRTTLSIEQWKSYKITMIKTKTKFAVLGCGHIGKRHAAMIAANADAELTALIDVKPRNDLSIENFDVPFYSSLEEYLDTAPSTDVISIASPNGLHEKHALASLEAGFNIVVEKPMALSKAGCEKIIYKALNKSRQVFCVMQNRYSPPSAWLKQIISEEVMGKIFLVQINCYWNRDNRYYKNGTWHGTKSLDGGTLFTQFSHFIDIMYWLFGDITNIHCRLADFNHQSLTEFEDSGVVTFDFIHGGIGVLNFSTSVWDKNLESSITIIGEKGSVKVGGQYMNEVEYCHIKDYVMPQLAPSNPPNDYGDYKGSAANHHYIIENVVEVLKGNTSITTNALEGLKVVEIIERIYQSCKL
jgi:UDP-N-acetyl-2-amino-2-deoxyglucuronate dehydrogenase